MIEEDLTDAEWKQVLDGTYIEPEAKINRDLSANMASTSGQGGGTSGQSVGTKVTALSLNEDATEKWATSDTLRADFKAKEEAWVGDPKTTNNWYDSNISSIRADMDALEAQKAFYAFTKNKGGINVSDDKLWKLKSELSTVEEEYGQIKAGTHAWIEGDDQWSFEPTLGGSPTVPTSGESFALGATGEQKAQLRDYKGIDERFRRSAAPQGDTPPRATASMKVASQITNQDILDLAKSGEFPEDLEHPKEDMDRWLTPSAVPLKQMYSQIEDPLDRAVFLRDRRDKVAKQRFDEIYRRELKPQLYTALAGTAAVAGLGALAYLAPTAVAFFGGMSRNKLANLAVDVVVDNVFNLPVLYLLYDFITSDDDAEKAELEAEFNELKKEAGGTKKDKGISEKPDGSIDL